MAIREVPQPPVSLKTADVLDAAPDATVARPLVLHLRHRGLTTDLMYPLKNDAVPAARYHVTFDDLNVLRMSIQQMPVDLRILTAERGQLLAIADTYTGGAHCCYTSTVLDVTGSGMHRAVSKDWGNFSYRPINARDRSGYVFLTADNAGAYAFASYAESAFPVLIESYRDGRFADVTGEYPAIVARDAAKWWREYALGSRSVVAPEAALAAYLADEYRLGRAEQGWARVHAQRGLAKDFDAKARAWLKDSGYAK
ncbi:MAG: hypothetical protein JO078_00910 [Candidatus Eremiobacteraeota bacterium]|nr:hypothetical protein [Candidatus Eremiobacteraeota bacterium]